MGSLGFHYGAIRFSMCGLCDHYVAKYRSIVLLPYHILNGQLLAAPGILPMGCCQCCQMLMVRILLIHVARGVQQRCLQTLALGSSVLEPELHILRLESRKLLPVGHPVQLVGILLNQLLRRVCVE